MRSVRALVIALTAGLAAPAQEPLSIDTIHRLLQAGVPSAAIEEALERWGAPASVSEAEVARVQEAGAAPSLVTKLEARLVALTRLATLAARYGPREIAGLGVKLLVPSGWEEIATAGAGGEVLVFGPAARRSETWFGESRLLLWVDRRHRFPRAVEAELARRIFAAFEGELARRGFETSAAEWQDATLGASPARHVEAAATEPRYRFAGRVGLRIGQTSEGILVVIGFTCPPSEALLAREHVEAMAASLEVRDPPGAEPRGEGAGGGVLGRSLRER